MPSTSLNRREIKFNINRGISIMRQLYMIVKRYLAVSVPGPGAIAGGFLSIFCTLHLGAGAYKKLHFHLLKLTHTNNELAGNNFVTESLPNLGYTKRNFHPA